MILVYVTIMCVVLLITRVVFFLQENVDPDPAEEIQQWQQSRQKPRVVVGQEGIG